jgi:hypothetical protein
MSTGAGSLSPDDGDENDDAVPAAETGAGLGAGTEAGELNPAGTAPGFAAVGSGVLVKEAGLAG